MAETTGGKPIEEMTHSEHVEYLESEAEKNAEHNLKQYEKQVAAFPPGNRAGKVPTDTDNDELRAENDEAVDAEIAAHKAASAAAKKPAPPAPPPPKTN